MKKILFILMPEKYRDEEFTEPYKIITGAGIKADVAGLKPGPAVGADGHKQTPNFMIDTLSNKDFDTYDALVIPGGPGSTKYLWNNKKIQEIIRYFNINKKLVATICYACVAAAQSGILEGKTATVFPTEEAKKIFNENKVNFSSNGCVILKDDKIITAQGPAFAREFGKAIIDLVGH
jgi:protease I